MHCMIAKAMDLPPRYLWKLDTKILTEACGRFADDHELTKNGVTEKVVLIPPVAVGVEPAADRPAGFDHVREVEGVASRITRHTGPQRR
ncbi:hypothetical protein Mth01_49900 [Sphaerimonospora thailandensis]|uniref:Uncharacterized protein n=1 Tax=Sphaerimonospora thailandensis TaxID=795644 RepID=A0A8J3W1G6_9ACTN|nr:hypothetical protein Mth01_49900 [Sphaerimonospora thailandensis]